MLCFWVKDTHSQLLNVTLTALMLLYTCLFQVKVFPGSFAAFRKGLSCFLQPQKADGFLMGLW